MRPKGKRNSKFEKSRAQLLGRLAEHVSVNGSDALSIREMAETAGTSVSTLQHYFETRDGVLKNVFAQIHQDGLIYLDRIPKLAEEHGVDSIEVLCRMIAAAWEPGKISKIHEAGLILGLGHAEFGPMYLNHVLEPTLQAVEKLFENLEERKFVRWKSDLRFAALALISPLILSLLHQNALGGIKCRKLNLKKMIEQHVDFFLAGWTFQKV